MAKAGIRKLKERRFLRWLQVDVYGKPWAIEFYRTHPIKQRKPRIRKRKSYWRKIDRALVRLGKMIDAKRYELSQRQVTATP